jgi:tetratricopeptide (TPR) repeat protein
MVLQGLTTGTAPEGPLESARRAVERGDFREVIDRFLPRAAEVDEDTLVVLALALDGAGRRDDAVRVLQDRGDRAGTDVLGTLAGRIKRRWVGERRQADAELSGTLYARGHELASAAGSHGQAYYHAINLAFLSLLHRKDVAKAREWAADALAHCEAQAEAVREGGPDPDAVWRAATQGEALLIQGQTDAALEAYGRALALEPRPWQALSMFWQGRLVADALGDARGRDGLDRLFGVPEDDE